MTTSPRGRDSSRNFTANLSRAMRNAGFNSRRIGSGFGPGVNLSPGMSGDLFCLGTDLRFWGHLRYSEALARVLFVDLLAFFAEAGYPHKVLDEPHEHDVVEWSWRIHVESKHDARNRCEGIILPGSEEVPRVR